MNSMIKTIIGGGVVAAFIVVAIFSALVLGSTFVVSEDLTEENKTILVLASEKGEQQNGAVDMAYLVRLEDGKLKNYTPVYPGGKKHPSVKSPRGGNLLMHDCLYYGVEKGMVYAQEIVKANTGNDSDAVVLVYTEGIDAVLDAARPIMIGGVETNLTAVDIIRKNDAYNGYKGSKSQVTGTMSRGGAVMVLVKALSKKAKDPETKKRMAQAALDQYNKGNIRMLPEGSFVRLLATKGFESIAS